MLRQYVQAGTNRTLGEQELARYRPPGDPVKFDDLWEACENARQQQEALHLEFLEHLETHGE